jgi:carbon storage regulator
MLVLSRKTGEKIVIGDGIEVTIEKVIGSRVVVGIQAPKDVRILRSEIIGRNDDTSSVDCGSKKACRDAG